MVLALIVDRSDLHRPNSQVRVMAETMGVLQVDPDADRAIAQGVVHPRSSPPPALVVVVMMMPAGRLTSAITVHDAQRDRRRQRDDERHREIMDDDRHLLVTLVVRQYHRAILPRVITGERDPLHTVLLREVSAKYCRGVTAPFNIHQQYCPVRRGLVTLIGVGTRCLRRTWRCVVVADVDMSAVVRVARAALSAGRPAAVGEPYEVLATRRHAHHRLTDKVRRQRRYGRVNV